MSTDIFSLEFATLKFKNTIPYLPCIRCVRINCINQGTNVDLVVVVDACYADDSVKQKHQWDEIWSYVLLWRAHAERGGCGFQLCWSIGNFLSCFVGLNEQRPRALTRSLITAFLSDATVAKRVFADAPIGPHWRRMLRNFVDFI